MTKKMEYDLLDILENFSKEIFNVVGGDAAQDWAVDAANNGYDSSKFTKEEKLYFATFRLAQVCHKIKLYKKESEELFSSVEFL